MSICAKRSARLAEDKAQGEKDAEQHRTAIARGVAWMASNFEGERNPGMGSNWLSYYWMTLRRAGEARQREPHQRTQGQTGQHRDRERLPHWHDQQQVGGEEQHGQQLGLLACQG